MPPFLYIDNHHHIGYNEADKEESSMKKKMTAAICALAMLALSACGASVTKVTNWSNCWMPELPRSR